MAGFLAVISAVGTDPDIGCQDWLLACSADDDQQFGRLLCQDAPDVLLLVGLPANCRELLDAYQARVPWGYAVALLGEAELAQTGDFPSLDEVWPPTALEIVHQRLVVLQRLAEQNQQWQALPKEAAASAGYANRLTLIVAERLLSPRQAAERVLLPGQQAAVSCALRGPVWQGGGQVALRVLGVDFPFGLASQPALTQVAEETGGYRLSRAECLSRATSLDQTGQLLAERVSLEYELQIERMQTVILRAQSDRLSAQISHHGKLAVAGELAAGMAHEIRNPLAAVRGFIQLLRRRLSDGQLATEIRYADYILDEIDRANQILNDFLAMTKPVEERRRLVDLNQLLLEMVQLVKHQAVLRGVELINNLSSAVPAIWAKPEALQQVFLNLLSNALQATAEGGRIVVTSSLKAEMVLVEVSDSGAGIAPDQLKQIFDPFFTTKAGGTGLGLAICRQILTEHGGSIAVDSLLGVGSTFAVQLPCSVRRHDR